MISDNKIILAATGASGAMYTKMLLEKFQKSGLLPEQLALVFSENAKQVWALELENNDYTKAPFEIFENNNFFSPIASGSSQYGTMIICPCSMGTLGRIASGISDNLITRAADVMLKERRKLILVTRETPLSLIHIENMKRATEAGAIIVPASPSFYSKPVTLEEAVSTVVNRILDLAGIEIDSFRWGK
jgi:flavin prenyltransferase